MIDSIRNNGGSSVHYFTLRYFDKDSRMNIWVLSDTPVIITADEWHKLIRGTVQQREEIAREIYFKCNLP